MKVFCVGMRDGSHSLMRALVRLGYGRIYSMGCAVQRYADLRAWTLHATGRRALDFPAFFSSWDATKAHPAMLYPREMLAAFPEVKVILLLREDEAWFESYGRMYRAISFLGTRLWFLPRCHAVHGMIASSTFSILGPGLPEHKQKVLAARQELYDTVRSLVPPERLLEFDVRQGWEPLCAFLGEPIPAEPFPWANRKQGAIKRAMARALLRDLGWIVVALAIPLLLGPSPLALGLLLALAALFVLLLRLGKV